MVSRVKRVAVKAFEEHLPFSDAAALALLPSTMDAIDALAAFEDVES